jgi:hypothetical protein
MCNFDLVCLMENIVVQEFEGRTTNFIYLLLITPNTWVITMKVVIDLVVDGY